MQAKVSFFLKGMSNGSPAQIKMLVSIGRYSISPDGKKKYLPIRYYTGISIPPDQWDKGRAATRSNSAKKVKACPIATSINRKLDAAHDRALQIAIEAIDNDWTMSKLKEALQSDIELNRSLGKKAKQAETATEWIEAYIKARIDIKEDTRRQQMVSLRKMIAFDKARGIKSDWKDFTHEYYDGYIKYLSSIGEVKPNTVAGRIKHLKLFLGEAKKIKKPVPEDYMFFEKPSEKVDSVYLTEPELKKIEELDYSQNERLANTRDWLLVACNVGLRVSDLMLLTKENIQGSNVTIQTQKTGAKVIVPITKALKVIIDRYDGFPRPISDQKYNKYLKEVAQDADLGRVVVNGETVYKWTQISSHTARRTFATLMYQRGIPAADLMLITGHTTESNFYRYIRTQAQENAEKLRRDYSDIFI